ncbi:MAG: YkgJ family cysteine cluster protein [Rickettsiales bacterium]|jgi:Fe-S-cluster containining protein|nr:YkgJ family cysteine cluster protein [Rickettsiales bacterium]
MSRQRKFKCNRCGECCGVPLFFPEIGDDKIVVRLSEKYDMKFVEIRIPKIGAARIPETSNEQMQLVSEGKLPRAVCPFVEKDENGKASCRIYEDRPVICKLFCKSPIPSLNCPNQGR